MCVSTQSISVFLTRTIDILGLHCCNIVVTLGKCQLIDTSINLDWAPKAKAQRSYILSNVTKTIVEAWWVEQTISSPNHKEVCNLWILKMVYLLHAKQYLLEDQVCMILCLKPCCTFFTSFDYVFWATSSRWLYIIFCNFFWSTNQLCMWVIIKFYLNSNDQLST